MLFTRHTVPEVRGKRGEQVGLGPWQVEERLFWVQIMGVNL